MLLRLEEFPEHYLNTLMKKQKPRNIWTFMFEYQGTNKIIFILFYRLSHFLNATQSPSLILFYYFYNFNYWVITLQPLYCLLVGYPLSGPSSLQEQSKWYSKWFIFSNIFRAFRYKCSRTGRRRCIVGGWHVDLPWKNGATVNSWSVESEWGKYWHRFSSYSRAVSFHRCQSPSSVVQNCEQHYLMDSTVFMLVVFFLCYFR